MILSRVYQNLERSDQPCFWDQGMEWFLIMSPNLAILFFKIIQTLFGYALIPQSLKPRMTGAHSLQGIYVQILAYP